MTIARFGQTLSRVEDGKFVTGRGRYVDDIELPGLAHGVLVYSTHPHARIRAVDTADALQSPGVLAVLTGRDLNADGIGGLPPLFMPQDSGGPPGYRTTRPLLANDTVRHVGDRIAFCIAGTPAQAREAADRIVVDYDPLPATCDVASARATGAPRVWEEAPDNVCFTLRFGDAAAADRAFLAAAHRVEVTLSNNRVLAHPMETRGAIGCHEQGDFTLYTSTQNPHRVRETLAQSVLRVPESRLRVIGPDVGGGFGMKGDTYPEEALVLLAARRVGRPVKWSCSRSDAFLLDSAGRDQVVTAEMALDGEGRILAIRARAAQNLGAYMSGAALVPLVYSLKLIPNVYDVPVVDLSTQGIFTHTAPTVPYRGAGRPEAVYVTERLLDLAAEALGVDGAEIRRRNYIQAAALPRRTATGLVYDSGNFPEAAAACLALADAESYADRQAASARAGRLRGRATVSYVEDTGVFNDRMELHLDPTGAVTVIAGTFSHGQSHATTYSQCVSGWLGVPLEKIRFIQGDTDQVSFGRGTYASGSAIIGGNALRAAADEIVVKAKAIAAHLLETSVDDLDFRDGAVHVVGTDRHATLAEIARWAYHPARLPSELRTGLEAAAYYAAEPPSFPNGCHACEVEIDPDTGQLSIDRYTAVDDFGRLINPMIAHGQVHGAVVQGIGQACGEHAIYDDAGQLVTASFMDYPMPRASAVPAFAVSFLEEPCRTNPLGVKGAGEGGCVAAPPVVVNAVLDALRPLGVRDIQMPLTPQRIWDALRAAAAQRRQPASV